MKREQIGQFVARDEEWRSYRINVHQCVADASDPQWLVQFACAPLQLLTDDGETVSRNPEDKPGVFWIARNNAKIRIVADNFGTAKSISSSIDKAQSSESTRTKNETPSCDGASHKFSESTRTEY